MVFIPVYARALLASISSRSPANRISANRHRIASRTPRGRLLFLEALQQRQLLSAAFTYDLRFAPGQLSESADQHSVDLSQPHANFYSLQLWGQITGDTDPTNDVWAYGYVTVASTQVGGAGALTAGGIAQGSVNTAIFLNQDGVQSSVSNDGIADWGTGNTASTKGWMMWINIDSTSINRPGYQIGSPIPGQSQAVDANTWEVLLATFTVDARSLTKADSLERTTLFNVLPIPKIKNGVSTQATLDYALDGASTWSNSVEIGQGAAFVLPAASVRTSLDFSKSVNADSETTFAPSDFISAYSDGTFGGQLQSVAITSLPAHGTLTLAGALVTANQEIPLDQVATLTYTRDANYFGPDSFAWNGSDGTAFSDASARVQLTIDNHPPTVSDVSVTVNHVLGHDFSLSDFTPGFSDPDAGNSLQSITITTLSKGSSLTFNGVPVWVGQTIPADEISGLHFAPDGILWPIASFGWNASDGIASADMPAMVNLNISRPIPTSINLTVSHNAVLSFTYSTFSEHFVDPDASLQSITITRLPVCGTLTLDGTLVAANQQIFAARISDLLYTPGNPSAPFSNSANFGWTGFDGISTSDFRSVIVTIANQPPTVSDFAQSVDHDATLSFDASSFLSAFVDSDAGDSLKSVSIYSLPMHGTLKCGGQAVTTYQTMSVDQFASLTYTPNAGYSGPDSFTWNASDGINFSDNQLRVNINVTAPPAPLAPPPPAPSTAPSDQPDSSISPFTPQYLSSLEPILGQGGHLSPLQLLLSGINPGLAGIIGSVNSLNQTSDGFFVLSQPTVSTPVPSVTTNADQVNSPPANSNPDLLPVQGLSMSMIGPYRPNFSVGIASSSSDGKIPFSTGANNVLPKNCVSFSASVAPSPLALLSTQFLILPPVTKAFTFSSPLLQILHRNYLLRTQNLPTPFFATALENFQPILLDSLPADS